MKTVKLLIILSFFATIPIVAIAQTNGNPKNHTIILQPINLPKPHIIEVGEPVAMYNTATDVLTVTLDATYYGEYTITIESTLTTVDYYPTSATTVIPLTSADNNITIYIESDDCGSLYGLTAASEWRKERGFQHFSGNSEI